MDTSKQFNADMLDDLIDDVTGNKNLPEKNQITELTTTDHNRDEISVDIGKVYNELGGLVSKGNEILDLAKYMVETQADSESINGAANMINSLNGVIKEFSKLYTNKIKHQQQLEIEKMKIDARKELTQMRLNNDENNGKPVDLVEFSQNDIIEKLYQIESSQ